MKQTRLRTRLLAVVLSLALLLSCGVVAAYAEDEDPQPALAAQEIAAQEVTPQSTTRDGFQKFLDFVFRNIGWLGYIYEPHDHFVYNQKPVQQWLGGYNELYDTFSFLANVYADNLKIKFKYEGKDWLIQLWKGAYAVCFAVGGEVGVYNKPETNKVNHYFCATSSDWLRIGMSIYHDNARVLTRAPEKHWWCTGYAPAIVWDAFHKPRKSTLLDANIELKSPDMAKAFITALEAKGFKMFDPESGARFGIRSPETYTLAEDGVTVRLIWQNVSDSWY
jgi:hypothetical protein